ncbi:hypothetical protein BJ508DRAFT_419429 [Ascobolus immersus RN42]|uniref:Uncharacterized protein n=1 Tax=Ascobolus immersus RN42 TaxID=1160509 RepID=A0A3N4HG27_ASCIM|nr:hypothetical protein BJ508DRAFT_419429 [Ascobolus immersus RN42]
MMGLYWLHEEQDEQRQNKANRYLQIHQLHLHPFCDPSPHPITISRSYSPYSPTCSLHKANRHPSDSIPHRSRTH